MQRYRWEHTYQVLPAVSNASVINVFLQLLYLSVKRSTQYFYSSKLLNNHKVNFPMSSAWAEDDDQRNNLKVRAQETLQR